MFDHRVENHQELSHASNQSDLWGFTCSTQSFVKRAKHRITSAGYQSRDVEHGSDARPTTPDRTTSSQCHAVAIERGNTDQGSNLLAVEVSEFWELSEE